MKKNLNRIVFAITIKKGKDILYVQKTHKWYIHINTFTNIGKKLSVLQIVSREKDPHRNPTSPKLICFTLFQQKNGKGFFVVYVKGMDWFCFAVLTDKTMRMTIFMFVLTI